VEPGTRDASRRGFPFATALKTTLREGYGVADLKRDALAGVTVGIVALPLSMALAIATGMPPQHGLYTAIVAGVVIALCGGSRVQVSGPTAAFVVILLPIREGFGPAGLMLASFLAGLFLVGLGALRFGRFVEFIPYPVVTGFTAGIGVVIASLQVQDLLGLEITSNPHHFLERIGALGAALGTFRWQEAAVGLLTLVVLIWWPKRIHQIPSPLAAMALATLGALALERWVPGIEIETIARRFSYEEGGRVLAGIPHSLPEFLAPWAQAGPDGEPLGLGLPVLRALLPSALAIAALGAIESLLSAVIADAMTNREHDPDGELVGQGLGNVVAPFFGGFAATGAIARTATNARAGARSPLAAVVHCLFLLAAMLLIAPALGHLPMAALAALLLIVAWNMSHVRHVLRMLRKSDRSDVVVLLACLLLTVLVDMVAAVTAGVMLAALLFLRRMVELTGTTLMTPTTHGTEFPIPQGTLVYRVAGPLFFGAAHKAMAALGRTQDGVHCVVLDLSAVPVLDATGHVNLESAISRVRRSGARVVLCGLQARPRAAVDRAGWEAHGWVRVLPTLEEALREAAQAPASP